MQTLDALKNRRSVRSFNSKPVAKNIIEQIVDSARLAPTARNVQPFEFIAVTDKDLLKKISDFTDNGKFISGCSCCLAVFCQDTKYYLEDGCAATENILIAATDLEVSSCWVAGDKKPYCEDIAKLLQVPSGIKLISLIALGYTDEPVQVCPKRPLSQLLHWQKF